MAGAQTVIDIDINDAEIQAELKKLAAKLGDLTPFFKDVGETLLNSTRERFRTQTAPDGTAWAALSPAYRARKPSHKDKPLTLSGVLRGTHPRTTAGSTPLLPLMSGLEEDAEPLPSDEFVEARVEIFPFAQVVRAGSRIRISVHTPGGDKVRWKYILAEVPDGAYVDVGHSAEHPSKVVLPLVPSVTGYPSAVPEDCHSLRAQPCRDFEEYTNTPAE